MKNNLKTILFYIFFSITVGLIVAGLDFVLIKGIEFSSKIRNENLKICLLLLPFSGVLTAHLYKIYGKGSGKGVGYVVEAAGNEEMKIPKRMAIFSIVATWFSHIFGASVAGVGAGIQIGASVSGIVERALGKKLLLDTKQLRSTLISSGIAAAFSGLIGTPIAAIIFSIELLRKNKIEYKSILPRVLASYTTYWSVKYLGINFFRFEIRELPEFDIKTVMAIVISGVIFSVVGYVFSLLLNKLKTDHYLNSLGSDKKIFAVSIILALTLYFAHEGRYSSHGTNLIMNSLYSGEIYWYDWIFKLLASVMSLGVGYQGGEVTPLFSIGASLGFLMGSLFKISIPFLVVLGYCTVFGVASNLLITALVLGVEVFGYSISGYLAVIMLLAHFIRKRLFKI